MVRGKRSSAGRKSLQAGFRKALKRAHGRSEQVIAVFVDVRGFSAFSLNCDSANIGLYVKRLFIEVIHEFFPRAMFYKSTGDGMMIIFPYREETIAAVAEYVIACAINLHSEFSHLAEKDLMITFDVPKLCGIGINRGTVCCLQSEGETLDYSGHVLNLAARLMDLARPSGIVMHATLGNMIPEQFKPFFEATSVYVRGIAETQPEAIFYLKDVTVIPESATSPLAPSWGSYNKKLTVAEWRKVKNTFSCTVSNVVKSADDFVAQISFPSTVKGLTTTRRLKKCSVRKPAGKTQVSVIMNEVHALTKSLSNETGVALAIRYREK